MTTEEMIENFIELGIKAYKKDFRRYPEGRALDRHETVKFKDIEVNCWKEYTVYKMGEYIKENLPEVELKVYLDGNNSTLELEIDDVQQQKLNALLWETLRQVA